MFAFLSALAPAAVANAVVNAGVGTILNGTARIVAGAVIGKVGADIARPAIERVVGGVLAAARR